MNEMFVLLNKLKIIALKINNLRDNPEDKPIKRNDVAGTTR